MYMAPEVFLGQSDFKNDVWSLGICIYEMAERRNPYAGYTRMGFLRKLLKENPPSIDSGTQLPDLVDFVQKCLVGDMVSRASVGDLLLVDMLGGCYA